MTCLCKCRQRAARLTCICSHNQAGIVGHVASEAVGGCLKVALMAGQVHQGDHLGGARNVLCRGVAAEHLVVQDVALAVQLQGQAHPLSRQDQLSRQGQAMLTTACPPCALM